MSESIQPTGRCGRPATSTTPERSAGWAADAFLNHAFEPLLEINSEIADQTPIEADFFRSLSHLAALYGWPLDDLTSTAPYPLNIAQSHEWAEYLLNKSYPDRRLIIVADETRLATVATVDLLETSATLYYIPVKFYWNAIRQKRRPDRLAVLDAIFAYLLRVVEVSYFTGEYGGYMAYQFDMLDEQAQEGLLDESDDYSKEYFEGIGKQTRFIRHAGEQCLRRFNNPQVLATFAERLDHFRPSSAGDRELQRIGREFLKLYQQYPQRSIMAFEMLIIPHAPELNDEGPHWDLSQTLSFYWTDDDEIFSEITNSIDADLGDCEPSYPKSVQVFDQPQAEITHSFTFQHTVYGLISDLIGYLFQLNEEHY